jgi:AcrR family transcriptional regulator
MTRPSRNHDQLLIETAKRMYPKFGASGMSIKMIADEAGVNLGMFSYYFKTKSNFIRIVLESFADEIRKEVEIKIPANAGSIETFRYLLTMIGGIFRSHRKLVLAMYRDQLNRDPDVTAFLVVNAERQFQFLQPTIERCQRDGYIDDGLSARQIESFCIAAVKAPIIVAAALKGFRKRRTQPWPTEELTDDMIDERVVMALRGVAGRKKFRLQRQNET